MLYLIQFFVCILWFHLPIPMAQLEFSYPLKLHKKVGLFLQDCGNKLRLYVIALFFFFFFFFIFFFIFFLIFSFRPQLTICTAIHFVCRFYQHVAVADHDVLTVARTCLFLACKSEETIRRLRDVINCSCRLNYFDNNGNDGDDPIANAKVYWELKDKIIRYEQVVLRVLHFEVDVKHPHHFVLHFVKRLNGSRDLAKLAWSISNDSMLTFLALYYEPHCIAVACIFLASELLNLILETEWWEKLDCVKTQLEDISMQLLDLYDDDKFQVPLPPKR